MEDLEVDDRRRRHFNALAFAGFPDFNLDVLGALGILALALDMEGIVETLGCLLQIPASQWLL